LPAVLGFYNKNGAVSDGVYTLREMMAELTHRNPEGIAVSENGAAVMNGAKTGARGDLLSFAGKIYNKEELPRGKTDAETAGNILLKDGVKGIDKINGPFAGAYYCAADGKIFLFRDHLGAAPLYYAFAGDTLVFASEIRALFKFPGADAELDMDGARALFALGPAVCEGGAVFAGVHSVLPGSILCYDGVKTVTCVYWKLESKPHTDDLAETAANVRYLLDDSVLRRMNGDKQCAFLSGGIDSSAVTAIMANALKKSGGRLETFSLDFEGNDEFFSATDYQPGRDRPFVEKMVDLFNLKHTYIQCGSDSLANYLYRAADARSLPGMADVDSSLMFFCDAAAQTNGSAVTGECADEIFNGYPWFHRDELKNADLFPWSRDVAAREEFLSDDFINAARLGDYAREHYNESLSKTPRLDCETGEQRRMREISFLTLKWFMPTLADRTERICALAGIDYEMPFADKRLVEYLWNVPHDMKTSGGVVKGLLREACKGLLPDEILFRRKSPFPKTYNPEYNAIISSVLTEIINDPGSPILQFADKAKIERFIGELMKSPNYGRPWFGQLMAGPQQIAYFIQVNYWLKKFRVKIKK